MSENNTKTLKELKDLEGFEIISQNLDNLCEADSLTYGYNENVEKLVEMIEEVKRIVSEEERGKLLKAMSEIDGLINESSHFIELTDLNASDGFKAYKLHQQLCRKRREIKNAIDGHKVLSKFYNNNKSTLLSELKNASKSNKEYKNNNRFYRFRNLNNLEEFKVFKNFDYSQGVVSRK